MRIDGGFLYVRMHYYIHMYLRSCKLHKYHIVGYFWGGIFHELALSNILERKIFINPQKY